MFRITCYCKNPRWDLNGGNHFQKVSSKRLTLAFFRRCVFVDAVICIGFQGAQGEWNSDVNPSSTLNSATVHTKLPWEVQSFPSCVVGLELIRFKTLSSLFRETIGRQSSRGIDNPCDVNHPNSNGHYVINVRHLSTGYNCRHDQDGVPPWLWLMELYIYRVHSQASGTAAPFSSAVLWQRPGTEGTVCSLGPGT